MMRKMALALALLALILSSEYSLRAQSIPAAVAADPSPDQQFPPGLEVLTVPSQGIDMDGFLYLAAGAAPHGTARCFCCTGCRAMR